MQALGLVAQLVEQRIENPCVGGSIPPRATKNIIDENADPLQIGVFFRDTESSCLEYFRPFSRNRPNRSTDQSFDAASQVQSHLTGSMGYMLEATFSITSTPSICFIGKSPSGNTPSSTSTARAFALRCSTTSIAFNTALYFTH